MANAAGRPQITARIAVNEEGPYIYQLCEAMGFGGLEFLEWRDIYPHWLVAEMNGEVVGAIEVLVGKPVGRAEFLSIRQDLHHIDRARISKLLLITAMATLIQAGSQVMMGIVPFENKQFKRMLKKRGGFICSTGNMIAIGLDRYGK